MKKIWIFRVIRDRRDKSSAGFYAADYDTDDILAATAQAEADTGYNIVAGERFTLTDAEFELVTGATSGDTLLGILWCGPQLHYEASIKVASWETELSWPHLCCQCYGLQ